MEPVCRKYLDNDSKPTLQRTVRPIDRKYPKNIAGKPERKPMIDDFYIGSNNKRLL